VIIQDGLKRMYVDKENVFYYLTTMNENYVHPDMPLGSEEGIIKGIYKLKEGKKSVKKKRVQLMGAGTILREVEVAAEMLREDWGVESDIWSVTSVNELARDGQRADRWNLLHPGEEPRKAYLTEQLSESEGPFVISTDYMKSYSEQLRAYVPGSYAVLGTDGFGRSDARAKLRSFFEVDRYFVTIASLKALADEGKVPAKTVADAMKKYGINPEKTDPTTC